MLLRPNAALRLRAILRSVIESRGVFRMSLRCAAVREIATLYMSALAGSAIS